MHMSSLLLQLLREPRDSFKCSNTCRWHALFVGPDNCNSLSLPSQYLFNCEAEGHKWLG